MIRSLDALFNSLLRDSAEAVLVLDQAGRIQTGSPSAFELLGLKARQTAGHALPDFVHDDDHSLVVEAFRSCLATSTASKVEVRWQPTHTRLRWCFQRVPGHEGSNWILAKASRLSESPQRREFLAHAGHELRNPLTSILAVAEALRDGIYGPLDDAQKGSLKTLEDNAHRQLELVNQFIDVLKIEARACELHPEPVNVAELLKRALASVQPAASARSIQLAVSDVAADTAIEVDAPRFAQVVAELFSIGIAYLPMASSVTLEFRLDQATPVVHLTLHGEPPKRGSTTSPAEPVDHEETSRTALARVRKLKPIGLTLLEHLVQLHQGSFELSANSVGGVEVQVLLHLKMPAKQAAKQAAPSITKPVQLPAAPKVAAAPLILLADDQPTLTAITRDYLESIGFRVLVASDGRSAVDFAFTSKPDLIMMDVQMPVMDGLEATQLIRQAEEPSIASIPIISLSGLAAAGDRERCLSAGATSYLAKPFGVKQLHAAISQLIAIPEP